jgi:hypothetical protein
VTSLKPTVRTSMGFFAGHSGLIIGECNGLTRDETFGYAFLAQYACLLFVERPMSDSRLPVKLHIGSEFSVRLGCHDTIAQRRSYRRPFFMYTVRRRTLVFNGFDDDRPMEEEHVGIRLDHFGAGCRVHWQ